jgi:hypothetical protein
MRWTLRAEPSIADMIISVPRRSDVSFSSGLATITLIRADNRPDGGRRPDAARSLSQ